MISTSTRTIRLSTSSCGRRSTCASVTDAGRSCAASLKLSLCLRFRLSFRVCLTFLIVRRTSERKGSSGHDGRLLVPAAAA